MISATKRLEASERAHRLAGEYRLGAVPARCLLRLAQGMGKPVRDADLAGFIWPNEHGVPMQRLHITINRLREAVPDLEITRKRGFGYSMKFKRNRG